MDFTYNLPISKGIESYLRIPILIAICLICTSYTSNFFIHVGQSKYIIPSLNLRILWKIFIGLKISLPYGQIWKDILFFSYGLKAIDFKVT